MHAEGRDDRVDDRAPAYREPAFPGARWIVRRPQLGHIFLHDHLVTKILLPPSGLRVSPGRLNTFFSEHLLLLTQGEDLLKRRNLSRHSRSVSYDLEASLAISSENSPTIASLEFPRLDHRRTDARRCVGWWRLRDPTEQPDAHQPDAQQREPSELCLRFRRLWLQRSVRLRPRGSVVGRRGRAPQLPGPVQPRLWRGRC